FMLSMQYNYNLRLICQQSASDIQSASDMSVCTAVCTADNLRLICCQCNATVDNLRLCHLHCRLSMQCNSRQSASYVVNAMLSMQCNSRQSASMESKITATSTCALPTYTNSNHEESVQDVAPTFNAGKSLQPHDPNQIFHTPTASLTRNRDYMNNQCFTTIQAFKTEDYYSPKPVLRRR
ncbi:hypothetical protein L9F63_017738, partial [Diploptera punctata]